MSNQEVDRCESAKGHYAIVLAAGLSTRMGRCKTTLPWSDGKTLLTYQTEQFLLAGVTPIVVLGTHNCDRQQDCSPGSFIVLNPHPSQGKTSSILIGLNAIPPDFNSVIISAIDQPRPHWLYQTLIQVHCASNRPITAPSYQGKLGHPLLCSNAVLPHLKTLKEETLGLRQLMKMFADRIQQVEFDTPIVLMDLNTPDTYQAHYRNFSKPYTRLFN